MPVRLGASDFDGPFYAGIGSRVTPGPVKLLMMQIAKRLREDGYVLRSGHAPGADQAFEKGALGQAEIFLPWPSFEDHVSFAPGSHIGLSPPKAAYEISAEFHPAWDHLSEPMKKLHARNAQIIFGPTCDDRSDPVDFVICWTPDLGLDGKFSGGTGQAIRIAEAYGIPVNNLRVPEGFAEAYNWVHEVSV